MTPRPPKSGSDGTRPGKHAPQLVWRLFLAMTLIVFSGAITILVVAVIIAPPMFHRHLQMISSRLPADAQTHVEEAFGQALVLSLGVGMLVALLATVAVTWLVSQRVAEPITTVAEAAARVAAGDLSVRVPSPGLGRELTDLTESFNTMAGRLAGTESVRRQLIADVAHELRNPLASLLAIAEAAADGVLPDDPETWDTVLTQAARMQRLVDDMSAVSKAEERQLDLDQRPVRAATLARDAVSAAQAQYDAAGVDLRLVPGRASPSVSVDAHRLGEVLANLLGNALRHSHPGDEVTVRVGSRAGTAVIEIGDTGDGFPPADADRLFERFYRGDTARQRDKAGSGIGLTLARSVVTAHHGTLRAHSDGPGRGATFTIALPAHPAT